MGFESDNFKVGVSTVDFGKNSNSKAIEKATESAVIEAQKSAQADTKDKPAMIYMSATPGTETPVINYIQKVYGKDVKIYGGTAADNTITGNWFVFGNNNKMFSNGLSLAVIYSGSKIGSSFQAGYLATDKTATATIDKNNTRRIKTLDGKPAGEVFNSWTGGKFTEDIAKGSNVLVKSAFSTLARSIKSNEGDELVFIHVSSIDPKDKCINIFSDVENGDKLVYAEGTVDALINRMSNILKKALIEGEIKKSDISGGLLIYCGGAKGAVADRIDEIVPKINESMNEQPWLGAFTFGEQGHIFGWGNIHGNLMSSMVVFGN